MNQDDWERCEAPGIMVDVLRRRHLHACLHCRRVWWADTLFGPEGRARVLTEYSLLLPHQQSPCDVCGDGARRPDCLKPLVRTKRHVSERKLGLWVLACRQVAGRSDHCDEPSHEVAIRYWTSMDSLPQLPWAERCRLIREVMDTPFLLPSLCGGVKPLPDQTRAPKEGDNVRPQWQCDDCQHILRWHDGTPGRIAMEIYRRSHYHLCPILADSLEEAGCMDQRLLEHLRGPNQHCEGCWAIDQVLGFE